MSTHFGGGADDGTNTRDESERTSQSACQADELRGLIERIALQLSDTDQRQSAALEQMLAKVEALGVEARSYKSKVPQEFLPAFERIEDGVAQLADRIAGAHGGREDLWAPATAQPVAAEPQAAPSGMFAEPAPAAESAAVEPEADVSQPVEHVMVETHQPASVLDPVMANDEAAWDQQAADALAAHYEHELGGLTHDEMVSAGDADVEAEAVIPVTLANTLSAPSESLPQNLTASLSASERDWLEERFVDIARKVEGVLAQESTDPVLASLGDRFGQFEQSFGSAMNDVAMRRDIEPLHVLEAHIADLAQQFEETRSQLTRLDNIEHSLAAVIDRLTDPRFDDALERTGADDKDLEPLISAAVEQISQKLGSAQPNMPDLQDLAEGIADAAAERVASRFADMAPAAPSQDSGADVGAIRHLLDQFISERREGEEQTAAMLDTMQRALIRVLDRVDALEVSHTKGAADYGRYSSDFGSEPAGPRAAESAPMPRGDVGHADEDDLRHDYAGGERGADTRPFADEPPRAAAPASSPQRQPSSPASIERLRQDFIADARRAKEKATSATPVAAGPASERAAAPRAAVSEPVAAGVKLGKPRPVADPDTPAGQGGASVVSRLRKPSRKLVVSAIVLMIAIPGAMMLLKKARSPAAVPTAIEKAEPSPDRTIVPVKPAKLTEDNAALPRGEKPVMDEAVKPEKGSDALPADMPKTDMEAAPAAAPQESKASPTVKMEDVTEAPTTMAPAGEAPAANKDALFRTNPRTQSSSGLGQEVEVPAEVEMPANSAFPVTPLSSRVPPSGITVANPRRVPTLSQLERLGERQTMAQLSSQLGEAQVNAVPATLIPEFMFGENSRPTTAVSLPAEAAPEVPATTASLSDSHKRALDMPPALVGPLSLRLAAAKGDPSAEFAVASRFADGVGVKQDLGEAMRWYQRAASRGFAQAQYRVATFYERGLGVTQDNARAKIWYQRAAESGNIKAMHNLAVLSAGRAAKVPDYPTAARWFKAAAEHGLADSQFNLAVLHESGLGVERDSKQAHLWFALAARNGDQEAKRRQDELEQTMAEADLTDARRRVDNWRAKQADRVANDPIAASEAWKAKASAEGAI